MVLNKIVGRNFFEKLGFDKLIIGDGVFIMFVSIIGGLLSIIYGENIGVLVIIRIYSIYVIGGVVVIVIVLVFIGKFIVLIFFIFILVMGGVFILFFGIIVVSGLRMLVESKVDFVNNWNLVIVLVILVVGIGNLVFNLKEIGINF